MKRTQRLIQTTLVLMIILLGVQLPTTVESAESPASNDRPLPERPVETEPDKPPRGAVEAFIRLLDRMPQLQILVLDGHVDQARSLAAALQNEPDRDAAYTFIAATQTRLGDLEGALDTARFVSERPHPEWLVVSYQDMALAAVMEVLKDQGHDKEAAALLRGFKGTGPLYRDFVERLWGGHDPH